MKKVFALVLALALVFSMASVAMSEGEADPKIVKSNGTFDLALGYSTEEVYAVQIDYEDFAAVVYKWDPKEGNFALVLEDDANAEATTDLEIFNKSYSDVDVCFAANVDEATAIDSMKFVTGEGDTEVKSDARATVDNDGVTVTAVATLNETIDDAADTDAADTAKITVYISKITGE